LEQAACIGDKVYFLDSGIKDLNSFSFYCDTKKSIVLVFVGRNKFIIFMSISFPDTIVIYDKTTKNLHQGQTRNMKRINYFSTVVGERLLVCGGHKLPQVDSSGILDTCELYTPSNGAQT
jgi:hypothetical protein